MTIFEFCKILAKFAKVHDVNLESQLFGEGLDLPSVTFLEFILEVEVITGEEINIDDLDTSIKTVGQLHERLFP